MSTTLTASTTAKASITSFDGTELVRVIQGGVAKKATALQLGALAAIAYSLTGSHVTVTAQAAGTVPITLKGAASQTANLTEWQNSAGTVLSSVSAAGVFSGPSFGYKGSTSGTTTLQASAVAGTTTLTLPAATDTLVGRATTDTLSNKTFVAPVLGAATGTSLALSGNGAVSAPVLSGTGTWYSGGSATTTKPYALIEPTGTTSTGWSTSGTGLGINAATGFTGNLLDLQLNGVARFSVSSAGITRSVQYNIGTSASSITSWGVNDIAFYNSGGTSVCAMSNSGVGGTSGFWLGSGYALAWGNNVNGGGGTADLGLWRDGAGILAQRFLTAAQTSRLYTTYTDASNGEWLELGSSSSIPYIAATKNGTGTQRALNLQRVATPAGGSSSAAIILGTTSGFGIYYGSGAPSVSAAKGSIYLRSDGSGTGDRMYVNTDGATTWTAVTTAA